MEADINTAFKQKVDAWLANHVNRNWDTDGFPTSQPYQCYDLAQLFAKDVVGSSRFYGLYAADIITQAGSLYRRINNTPEFVPQAGDIAVFDKRIGGGAGHVSICDGRGNTSKFWSLDQNWSRPTATYVEHDYTYLIGVLRPLESEAPNPSVDPVPAPVADNKGIINGQGVRGRVDATRSATSPWYFNDRDSVTIYAKKHGENILDGPYAPSDYWYLVSDDTVATAPRVWVSDAFVRTTQTPANVPDWVAPTEPAPQPPIPTPEPAPVYIFTKELDCVTDIIPAGMGNFEVGNFPLNQETAIIHDFGTPKVDTFESTINTFKNDKLDKPRSAHFVVSGKRIIQMVSLKDRAYHAGSQGNGYIGIETDPKQDIDTIESVRTLLQELRTRYGRQLKLIKHSSLMVTSCGDDVNLANYDITIVVPPITPNPPADPTITDRLNAIELILKHIQDFLASIFKNYNKA